jgi:hypothetical protein
MKIEEFAKRIPSELLSSSGKVFYSGRIAFRTQFSLYVIGVNPGGDPPNHQKETVGNHTAKVLRSYPDDWSAYRDESWEGKLPGTYGMAPRVLHLFNRLGLNPGEVPSSNLVFVRSRREEKINRKEMLSLADLCWPFHELVIQKLKPRVILCLGGTAGTYVRGKFRANKLFGEFIENNNRKWRSKAFENISGMRVVAATHPSIADWTTIETDPSQLVRKTMS